MYKENKRPKLNLKTTPLEFILNAISLCLIILSVVYLIVEWPSLPNQVPMHFNGVGEADGWGSKWTVWVLIFIGSLLWVGMLILSRFPHVFNYLTEITDENAEFQYKNAKLMMTLVNTIIIVNFTYLSYQIVQVAKGLSNGLGTWNMLIFILVLLGTIFTFMFRSLRVK
ncbi:DUF1648 domain-containing protein [Bacillus luteolus]|uniref:DUF1648 domain-containing protein n=1 Tax=Litchfieldia luteola TaxID=682179 RepID=A0ABR9QKL6_9BACI|nr:DUF1648 domain-containing protein [Cytobacillus luteolus]MBE4909048.1 DUF1648 domain-containing protein [Cytobacillus luteolus]MBP1941904.1 putative membrane protein [Cytobacillus luteolus]